MFSEKNPPNCTLLSSLFPPGLNDSTPPIYTLGEGPYHCVTRQGSVDVGQLPDDWCTETTNVTARPSARAPVVGRQDLYWTCS